MIEAHRRRWSERRLSTARADRAAAAEGVALAYRAVGLARPETILWTDGPLELARAWSADRRSTATGANVRFALVDRVRDQTARQLRRMLGPTVRRTLIDAQRPILDTLDVEVARAIARRVRVAPSGILARIRPLLTLLVNFAHPGARWGGFVRGSVNPFGLTWLWPPRFLFDCCGLAEQTSHLRGHWLLATETGWMIPHERVCWLADRPSTLGVDARGRLHGAAGPALAYPDGLAHYAWKGIEVPRVLIEVPEAITVAAIDDEPDQILRRTMIDIITPRRFVEMGGAVKVGQDDTGILWRRSWWSGDSWAAVEVVNGSREPDGTRQRYFLQVPAEIETPRAAVAWTYGMREDEYRKLAVRT